MCKDKLLPFHAFPSSNFLYMCAHHYLNADRTGKFFENPPSVLAFVVSHPLPFIEWKGLSCLKPCRILKFSPRKKLLFYRKRHGYLGATMTVGYFCGRKDCEIASHSDFWTILNMSQSTRLLSRTLIRSQGSREAALALAPQIHGCGYARDVCTAVSVLSVLGEWRMHSWALNRWVAAAGRSHSWILLGYVLSGELGWTGRQLTKYLILSSHLPQGIKEKVCTPANARLWLLVTGCSHVGISYIPQFLSTIHSLL